MKIALHDHENNNYPNLALMKLSARHKEDGDYVEWYDKSKSYDIVYSSKIFTWTELDNTLPPDAIIGGTGYDIEKVLPFRTENMMPDYSLYDCSSSYGFLTRGCIRKCPWCFVPQKEGMIRANQDIMDFLKHDHVILMDNNVLAHSHGIEQIEKMISLGITVDFNQGLDARLIDNSMARLLARLKWKPAIRLACDKVSMLEPVRKAVELLRWHNATPVRYFCYVLVDDIESALERVMYLKGIHLDPFCQPYRDKEGNEPAKELKKFARFVNHKGIFKTTTWEAMNL